MATPPRLLLAALLVPVLAACGGTGGGSSAPSASAAAPSESSAPASPSPSALSSQDAQLIGLDAQKVGLVVAQWSIDHRFAIPADDAAFQKDVDYQDSLSSGEKAAYRKSGSKKFEVCVTKSADGQPAGWGIYESTSGGYTSGVGAPSESFCP